MRHRADADRFDSRLGDPIQRFLAQVVENGLIFGVRTPEEFLRHFSPLSIAQALRNEPERRADILEVAVGMRRRLALHRTASACGRVLEMALLNRELDPAILVRLFRPDDRARVLEKQTLWGYVTARKFWAPKPERSHEAAREFLLVLDEAVRVGLVHSLALVDQLGASKLAECLPHWALATMLDNLVCQAGKPRTNDQPIISLDVLIEHLPGHALWAIVRETIEPALSSGAVQAIQAPERRVIPGMVMVAIEESEPLEIDLSAPDVQPPEQPLPVRTARPSMPDMTRRGPGTDGSPRR